METIALYMRFSGDDGKNRESDSIANQRELLYNFIQEHHEFAGCNILEFFDDGYSGVNFERPEVKKMLSMAGSVIQCIIVKDFSRFGRNLIEVGDYLDQIFPFLGVRFIAVNEHYDSKQSLGSSVSLDVSLKAMVYEMYSRDISEKARCVMMEKMRQGKYMGRDAFYGYRRSVTEKQKLEVDEDAAEVVRRIFTMAASGVSMSKIAQILNQEKVPSPLMYRKIKHIGHQTGWPIAGDVAYWTWDSIKRVIKDERYTGCMVCHKRTKKDISSKKTVAIPRLEWIIVRNTHEAIVSEALFEQAQKVLKGIRRTDQMRKPNKKFRGLLKCAYCGKGLIRNSCMQPYFHCPNGRALLDLPCANIHLDEKELEKAVLDSIQEQVQARKMMESKVQGKNKEGCLQAEIKECQAAISRYKAMQATAFEEYAEGKMGKQEYLSKKQEMARRQEEENERYATLSEQLLAVKQSAAGLGKDLGEYALSEEPTREMLEEFVCKIMISGKDEIKIVWKFDEDGAGRTSKHEGNSISKSI